MATYSIVGAGGSSSNPIHVFVGCDDTVTEVCWTARISRLDNCNVEMYRDEMICQTASTYTNQLTWTAPNGQVLTVHYEIHRPPHEECHPTPPGCLSACTNLTAYAVPGSVEEGSTDEIKVYYEYLLECYGIKNGVVTGLTLSDFTPEGDLYKYTYTTSEESITTQCSTDVYVHKKGGDDCTEGCVADISITFSKNVVPASGATIQVIVSFKKTVTDENCKKKITTGSFTKDWPVECKTGKEKETPIVVTYDVSEDGVVPLYKCSNIFDKMSVDDGNWIPAVNQYNLAKGGHSVSYTITGNTIPKIYELKEKCFTFGEEDKSKPINISYYCCKDHYIEGSISIAEIRERAKLGDCEIRYGGKQTASDLYYSVLQKARTTDECEGYCEEKTTYCVDQSSVKVCYEKRYLSDEWVCEGDPSTDCDCTALSVDGVNGTYSVPFTGGRIKVTWRYSAHTKTETCAEYDTLGNTWEEIITIGGCDERPERIPDCPEESKDCCSESVHNKVIVGYDESTTPPTPIYEKYDDATYKDCEICDSECCYNYDGKGTCKCVILFKEQTPGCTTCDSCDVYDEEEQRVITYNKIRYEFVQDCTTICNYDKNTQFEQQPVPVDKCFTGETGATVPFTSTTEYYGAGCPAPQYETGSVPVTVNIPTVNNSNREKVAYEDEMIKVIQAAGPCEVPTYCDCDALTLEGGGGGDCPEGEISYVYGAVDIECRSYSNESVDVPYTKYCDGTPIDSGTSAKTISVDCNKGVARDITVSGVKLHQAGGCTDEQCGATPPASDCACSVTWGDATLNAYISNITKGRIDTVLTDIISADGTKCTYKYLKAGYDFVKNKPQATISWFLANMMAELTPYVISTPKDMYLTLQNPLAGDTATNYFVNASHKYGGLKLNYFTSEQTYNERINGGIQYALFKYSDYDGTNTMAENARTELRAINTDLEAQAKLRHDGDQDPSHSNPYFTRDDAVHMLPIVPNDFPTNNPCETGCDWGYTQSIINQYPDAQSLSGVHDFQALRDKDASNEYFASILGLSGNKWLTYLYNTQDIGDAGGNQIKGKFRRPRPGTQNNLNSSTGGTTFSFPAGHPNAVVYMCDCSIEYGSSTTGGSNCDYCIRDIDSFTNVTKTDDNPYKSYSSGHSAKAMINLLTTLEVAGDSMNVAGYTSRTQRIMDYCHNRVVVRAHWKSDTIAGKLASAAQIGYLNGYIEFHDDVETLKNS